MARGKKKPKKKKGGLIFQVKPRLLTLLGDQLIRDASLAVFELVKNAYDADANTCTVVLSDADNPDIAKITIEDNGCGMDAATLRNVWMMIGTDYRTKQRAENVRSPKYKRFPLGEKGLGRLSIHKLGRVITLVTRVAGGEELVMEFNWDALEQASDLNSAHVALRRRVPETFKGNKHGTRLEVTKLREGWKRGEIRRLHRAVNALCSPYEGPDKFTVTLETPGNEDWLKKLFTAEQAGACALYRITGSFSGSTGKYSYSFTPPADYAKQLTARTDEEHQVALQRRAETGRKYVSLDLSQYKIGTVKFEFLLFDRDLAVLKAVTGDPKGLKDYLDENGGIRIYRDGIRVYDFGEPGNDWLNLDARRVNTPTARTSNNQILGVLRLDATESSDLREKTNREGFIENDAYAALRDAVISVLTQVEAEKTIDQKHVREAFGRGTGQRVFEKLTELRTTLEEKGVLAEVEPKLKAVEKELEIYRDQLLHAAVPGLTLGVMLHGAEKILDELRATTERNGSAERIKELVERLYRAMRPVSNLLKNPGAGSTTAAILIKEAIFSSEMRLRKHRITLLNGMAAGGPDFKVHGSKQMLVASITNLIDNSIHWLESKNAKVKTLYIGTTTELEGGPAIVVADDGPGFGNDDPEVLVSPFFTRRNGGMGLGLYIVSEVMRINKGRLLFPDDGDLQLPAGIDGAVVALQFSEEE